MRRLLPLLVLAILAVALVAPAQAQVVRDPFNPGAVQGAPSGGATQGQTGPFDEERDDTQAPVDEDTGVVQTTTQAEQLPQTGMDAIPWMAAALALLLMGAGALIASKTIGPAGGMAAARR